ncbi:PAS domain S-box protein [Geomesophilobacter sediminis]|uniref:histidine kinase n=1 Tax=Geomesophilobacter sediminis TaxID=2798584 RepID=A0A8J7IR12_9BACT|nr:PAS domain S-box protein [Geomesophilobacter sediminis]MBJ6726453.1 PAS domain S-box protein [Geomesophilobacter sediminis]
MTKKSPPAEAGGTVSTRPPGSAFTDPADPLLDLSAGCSEGADPHLGEICAIVRSQTGHDFSSYKRGTLLRRIQRRIAVTDASGTRDYLSHLSETPAEAEALAAEILIGVTGFFRDPEAFTVLEQRIIPRLFAAGDSEEPLRIWHACCATGEEVYSMAMLVREYLTREAVARPVLFFASDIDEAALAQARAGVYSEAAAAEIGAERLQRFFVRVPEGWRVSKELREMVVFAHHSLIKDPPFSRLDLLVCRNFLIYLNQELQQRLVPMFHQILRPDGVLFLGSAETIGSRSDLFTPVSKKWKIFRRLDCAVRGDCLFPTPVPVTRFATVTGRRTAGNSQPSAASIIEKVLLERYAPPSVVVDDKYGVVHVSGRVSRFLEIPEGELTRDVLKMAREELRPLLRAAIFKAFADQRETVLRGVQLADGAEAVNLVVQPLPGTGAAAQALVIFEPAPPPPPLAVPGERQEGGAEKDLLIRQLEEQLRLTHEQLQATSAQMEATQEGFLSANEQLVSMNEEYQSANEELQSTNEELETSKEELQALNEELATVNTELQTTVEELHRTNSDMENLFASSEVATLFLDRALNIKRFTPSFARILNLIPSDVGRPFRHLAGIAAWEGLAEDAEAIINGGAPVEREWPLPGSGRHYLMRVLPYLGEAGPEGIVVTLVDLTERKRMEDAITKAKDEWERTFDTVPDLIAIVDPQHRVLRANRAMAQRVGITPQEWIGRICHQTFHGTDTPHPHCPHQQTLRDGTEHTVEISEEQWGGKFLVTTTPLTDGEGELVGSVHVARDITELKRAEDELRQSKLQVERHLAEIQTILDHLNDGVVTADLEGNLFHWNPTALAMHGFTSLEECRRKLPELAETFVLATEEGELPVERWPLARILAGETLRDWEVRVRRKDTGLERIFSYGGTLARDHEGQPVLAVVSVTDVTERRRAEEVQARLAAVVQNSDDAIISKDRDGIIVSWNDGAERMFGYRAEEAIGRPVTLLIPPKQQHEEEEILHRILAGERTDHFETVRITRDGRLLDVSVTASPVKDRHGRIIGASKIVRDITEHKRGEEALRQSELQFRTLADAIPQLCWMANGDGWIFWYNQRWYEYTGTTPEQMAGWGWQSVHDPAELPGVMQRWQESLANAEPFDMVFPLRGADGVFRPFLTRILPVRGQDGTVVRWFGTNTDISEQRRIEQELRRSNDRLNLIAETTADLLKSDAPQQVVDTACQRVLAFLDCDVFFNFLVDEEAGRLHLNACAGIPEAEAELIEWLDYGVAVCGCAAQEGCRIVAEEIQTTPDPRTDLVRSYGVRAYACHPLLAQGVVLGTLSFGTRSRDSFTNDELALMKTVADLVSIAMQRKRMQDSLLQAHHELEQRVRERTEELAAAVETLLGEISERERAEASLSRLNRLYMVLSEIDQALVRATDRESIFRDFCRIAVEHGGFLLAWVIIKEEDGAVRTVAASGMTSYLDGMQITLENEPEGEGPTGISLRNGTYYICNDFQNDPHTRPWHERGRRFGIRASASIAIKEENRVIGALTLYAGEKDFFDLQHVALLRQMGNDISFGLGNLIRESRRRAAEKALQEETLERLRAVEDLREKERLLIQQSRLAALGEMIGNIAHQWRQPLNALGLMIQELPICYEAGDFSHAYLERTVEKVMQVVFHMSQTIDDFRYFFRPDKEKVTFSTVKSVEKVLSIIEGSMRANRIRVEVSQNGNPLVHGYPSEFSQVLLNILLNARDVFAERGVADPKIEVRLFEEGGQSVVTIRDNAGGIPEEVLDKVFDPYFTTKGPDKGTGVGLYMSKVIIENNMGGRLIARNAPDGAEFRIESAAQ